MPQDREFLGLNDDYQMTYKNKLKTLFCNKEARKNNFNRHSSVCMRYFRPNAHYKSKQAELCPAQSKVCGQTSLYRQTFNLICKPIGNHS